MIWLYSYVIGVVISICIAGFLTRGQTLKDDDCSSIAGVIFFWPLFAAIALAFGPPILLFALCKGELDEPIKEGFEWVKIKWNSLGN
jgi:hypothetical protein